jgi:tetratricopeptide (TPR) repeat protein
MRLKIISLFMLAFLSASVSNTLAQQPLEETATQAEIAMQRAVDHYQAGLLNEAAGLLRGFVVSHPDSSLIDQAYYYLASIHNELGDTATAIGYLDKTSAGSQSPATTLLQSELLLLMGNATRAVALLLQLETQRLDLPERQARYLSLGEGLAILEEPQKALYFYQQALVVEGAETPREVLARIYILLSARFNEADLAEAVFMYHNKPVAYLAMLQLGWRALATGQKELAQEWVSAAMMAPAGCRLRLSRRSPGLAVATHRPDPISTCHRCPTSPERTLRRIRQTCSTRHGVGPGSFPSTCSRALYFP